MKTYHYPKLSSLDLGLVRSSGPGLGNLLFPICRALVVAQETGGEFVYPTMRQFKLGPMLRRESDTRIYGDVLRGRSRKDWKDWFTVTKLLIGSQNTNGHQTLVCHEGMKDFFHSLSDQTLMVRDWFNKNLLLKGGISYDFDIAIHVRQGDFAQANNSDGYQENTRLNFEWYLDAINLAKVTLGTKNPRLVLFTDGEPHKVAGQLGLENYTVDPSGNASTAIKNMSKARLIIGSQSTFSLWASFLCDSPSIWSRTFELHRYKVVRNDLDLFL